MPSGYNIVPMVGGELQHVGVNNGVDSVGNVVYSQQNYMNAPPRQNFQVNFREI